MSDLCRDGTAPVYGPGPFVCASCGLTVSLAESIPNRDLLWYLIGVTRVCRDAERCYQEFIAVRC